MYKRQPQGFDPPFHLRQPPAGPLGVLQRLRQLRRLGAGELVLLPQLGDDAVVLPLEGIPLGLQPLQLPGRRLPPGGDLLFLGAVAGGLGFQEVALLAVLGNLAVQPLDRLPQLLPLPLGLGDLLPGCLLYTSMSITRGGAPRAGAGCSRLSQLLVFLFVACPLPVFFIF